MFLDPSATPFDLRFRLFRIPVRVQPWFWIIMAALGWGIVDGAAVFEGGIAPGQRLPFLLLWVACTFVSILLHEMGHVFMGRCFGSDGHIILYGFGGLAVGSNNLRRSWQRIAVSIAGPGIQLGLYGLLFVLIRRLSTAEHPARVSPVAHYALTWLMWINLFWPLLNLLPIWPLDGGMIAREVIGWFARDRAVAISLVVSMIVAAGLALNEFIIYRGGHSFLPYGLSLGGDLYMAIFFAIFAVNNYFEMQAARYQYSQWDKGGW